MVFETEKQARSVGETRMKAKIEKDRNSGAALSLDDLYSQIKEGQIIDLNIIVKADVQGTAEAVKASLEKIDVDGVRVNVIRSTVGAISESDVILASASQAIIYGFNVRPDAKVRNKAEEENVEIRLHNVIYKMVEEIESSQIIMLPGGFSGGDEPEGSGKFIATTFRNPKVKEAVTKLLNNRDGLMLGICNGFQALIKLGLVPYG